MKDTRAGDCKIAKATLGIDPGARTTGMAVTTAAREGEKVIDGVKVKHRPHRISQALASRRSYRRLRRGRIRRRPARFNNRHRPAGWLPLSLNSIRANILTNARHLTALYPICHIAVDTCRFDPRLIADPDVFGEGYQNSERDHMQVREYVMQRDNRTCQYCGKTGVRLEIDHVVPKSRSGSDRVSNLAASYRECNQGKGNMPVEEFLRDQPDRQAQVKRQLHASLQSAAHLNALMPFILQDARTLGLPVLETDAVSTAWVRHELGIEKTHVNDAACLSNPTALQTPERITTVSAVGHGRRQMLTQPSRYGTPRFTAGAAGKYRGYRAWCRLPRSMQGFTTMPGHKLRQRRVRGICSGDLVRYWHPDHGIVMGTAVMANGKTRVRAGAAKDVPVRKAVLLQRSNGYRYHAALNKSKDGTD